MYTIGICDDERSVCARLEELILKRYGNGHSEVEVEVFITGEDLIKHLESGMHLDLLLLDIELGNVNGVEIGKYIRTGLFDESMHIVYISSKQGYAMELFDNRPLNFFIKPLDNEKLFESIEKAIELTGDNNLYFECKTKGDMLRIPYINIIYFHSRNKKIVVRLSNESIEFYGKLSEIMKDSPDFFIQIHKSYLVNHSHIKKYEYDTVEMTNGESLTISQSNRKLVRSQIMNKNKVR